MGNADTKERQGKSNLSIRLAIAYLTSISNNRIGVGVLYINYIVKKRCQQAYNVLNSY